MQEGAPEETFAGYLVQTHRVAALNLTTSINLERQLNMALFGLDYDLRSPVRNYQPLYDELARFSATRILESSWSFVRFNTNATGLRDHFRRFMDVNDGLVVYEVTDWATYNTLGTPKAVTA